MKRIVFFSFTFFTFYIAAMYQSLPLMFLFMSELILIVWMWILSRYLKKNLKIELPNSHISGELSAGIRSDCNIVNSGKLPVRHFRISLHISYLQETREAKIYLYGTSEIGKSKLNYKIYVPYCGNISIEFKKIRIYDYLGLFFGTTLISQKLTAVVFPPRQVLNVELSSFKGKQGEEKQDMDRDYIGDESYEIRQLREYRAGDSYRHIHWNQSAKTGNIWVKEYEKEANASIALLLEIEEARWKSPKDMDAFYRLLYALVLGLLQKTNIVKVYWYGGHAKQLAKMDIGEERQCQELLYCIYQIDFSKIDCKVASKLQETFILSKEHYLKLNSALSWYLGEEIIYQFSVENLQEEIAKKVFLL